MEKGFKTSKKEKNMFRHISKAGKDAIFDYMADLIYNETIELY